MKTAGLNLKYGNLSGGIASTDLTMNIDGTRTKRWVACALNSREFAEFTGFVRGRRGLISKPPPTVHLRLLVHHPATWPWSFPFIPRENSRFQDWAMQAPRCFFVAFCAFLSYGATQQRRRGTKTRPVGGPFHRTTQQPRSLISQVHDRGWSCGHGRYIPMSVT